MSLAGTTPEQPDRPDAPGQLEPWLFVVFECEQPLAGGARFPLAEIDTVVIGRSTQRRVELRGRELVLGLESSLLSSTHLRFHRTATRWMVEDAASRNGTFMAGRRLTREVLQDGDIVEAGRVFLRFRILSRPRPAIEIAPPVPQGFRTHLPTLAVELGELARIAASPLSILLLGETGTGKEVLARGIHELSRRSGPLVPVNCGALSPSLLDSQLFGHVKGSFTGAMRDELGFVRSADGGTLFLDEIGDLPMPAQAALLRMLQEREVVPVGGTRAVKVDVRIVAATHRKLDLLAARGEFRADLFARLSGHTHFLMPLRERREDLGLIVADLLRGQRLKFSADAGRELVTNDWPLNIRQLEQGLARATTLADDGIVHVRHLISAPRTERVTEAPERASVDDAGRREELHGLLVKHAGNITEVARALGYSRMQVHRWMQRYGIDPAMYRNR